MAAAAARRKSSTVAATFSVDSSRGSGISWRPDAANVRLTNLIAEGATGCRPWGCCRSLWHADAVGRADDGRFSEQRHAAVGRFAAAVKGGDDCASSAPQ